MKHGDNLHGNIFPIDHLIWLCVVEVELTGDKVGTKVTESGIVGDSVKGCIEQVLHAPAALLAGVLRDVCQDVLDL